MGRGWPDDGRSGGQATGAGSAADAPLGRGAVARPGFPWPPPFFPSASSFSRLVLIAVGCGCGCSIARRSHPPVAGWCCAPRGWGGRGSCRWPWGPGACGGCEGPGKAHQTPRSGAVGQWAGAVRIVRRGRRSPERVWTLLALPLESLPTAPAVKGAGGRRQQRRTPLLVLTLAGWLLFRLAARQLCGSLNQEPPRSSWATRPHGSP